MTRIPAFMGRMFCAPDDASYFHTASIVYTLHGYPNGVCGQFGSYIWVYPRVTPECYAFRVTLEPILGFCDASRMGLSLQRRAFKSTHNRLL